MKPIIRSILFVPGSRPDRFQKAVDAEPDLVCIDLEDAVLGEDKAEAREHVSKFIAQYQQPICVRINPLSTTFGQADIRALAPLNPAFIMLAKCETLDDIHHAEQHLSKTDSLIIGQIETPLGLEHAKEIAKASKRLFALSFGAADMADALGCDNTWQSLLFIRSQLVLAAKANGLDLIDAPFIDFKNEQALAEETTQARSLGFTSKAAIHPSQLDTIHQYFMPTVNQIEFAKAVIEQAGDSDDGLFVVDGKMIDKPIIISARKTLAIAKFNNKE